MRKHVKHMIFMPQYERFGDILFCQYVCNKLRTYDFDLWPTFEKK